MSSSSEQSLPLAAVLARAAAELRDQAGAVEAMHALALAAEDGTASAAGRGAVLRAGQSIDVVAQHLLALSEVLAGLAQAVPAGVAAPGALIDAVPLSDLAARLRGAAGAAPADDGLFELL